MVVFAFFIISVSDVGSLFALRKEAVLSIANLTSGGSKQHIECLVEQSVIKPLSDLLTESTDTEILTLVLDTFSNLLKAGLQPDGSNPIADIFKECGAMEKIGECQSHRFFVNENVCEKAVDLIETKRSVTQQ